MAGGLPLTFEKRKKLRRMMERQVAILQSDGTLVCECTLTDVSDDGARLKLSQAPGATATSFDPQFILSLSRRGNLFRKCELVWHKDNEVGVRFVKPKAS